MKEYLAGLSEDGVITDEMMGIGSPQTTDDREWASQAESLAEAAVRMANRSDTTGGYRNKRGKVTPTTRKRFDHDWLPLLAALRAHFRGERVIGLHSTTPGNICRWIAFDIDAHGPEDDADDNHAKALLVGRRLEARGLQAYIFDSNGKGGFHVWAMLHEPTPSEDAFALARKIADGLGIECFPKQPQIRKGGFGNWIRLPGKHHKRNCWSRLWTNGRWATARETAAAVMEMARSAVLCQTLTTC
jgi:hypothetical protein